MKFLGLAVLSFAALAQAIDLSKYTPKTLEVWPKKFPENLDQRIVNGEEAAPHQFPYQVALFIDAGSFCGGSILQDNLILTAAHCIDKAHTVKVVAGAHNIWKEEDTQQSITSTKFIVHENWNPRTLANDIALIVLPQRLNLDGKTAAAVKLYQGGSNLENVISTASGWGRPSDSTSAISPVLRFVSDSIISNTECNDFYGVILPSNICLNGRNRKSVCLGDSGGPLVIENQGEIQEIGIASFVSSSGCASGLPSGYTRVSAFNSWIQAKRATL